MATLDSIKLLDYNDIKEEYSNLKAKLLGNFLS